MKVEKPPPAGPEAPLLLVVIHGRVHLPHIDHPSAPGAMRGVGGRELMGVEAPPHLQLSVMRVVR